MYQPTTWCLPSMPQSRLPFIYAIDIQSRCGALTRPLLQPSVRFDSLSILLSVDRSCLMISGYDPRSAVPSINPNFGNLPCSSKLSPNTGNIGGEKWRQFLDKTLQVVWMMGFRKKLRIHCYSKPSCFCKLLKLSMKVLCVISVACLVAVYARIRHFVSTLTWRFADEPIRGQSRLGFINSTTANFKKNQI